MTYDARADGEQSYLAAIAAKKARGDDYYLLPHKNARLDRSRFESVSGLVGRCIPIQSIDKRLSGTFAGWTVHLPLVGHQDFSGSLQGVHIQDASSIDDADSGAKPSALRHGGEA